MTLRGLRLLIVDDDVQCLTPTMMLLRSLGAETVAATSMRLAREILASGTVFDCAIVDLLLLNGNGVNLIRELELTHPELACVLLSGADLETLGLEGYHGEFVGKGGPIERLEAAILRSIRRRRANADTDPAPGMSESEPPTRPE